MLQLRPLDENVPIFQQLNSDVSPVVLINVFLLQSHLTRPPRALPLLK